MEATSSSLSDLFQGSADGDDWVDDGDAVDAVDDLDAGQGRKIQGTEKPWLSSSGMTSGQPFSILGKDSKTRVTEFVR